MSKMKTCLSISRHLTSSLKMVWPGAVVCSCIGKLPTALYSPRAIFATRDNGAASNCMLLFQVALFIRYRDILTDDFSAMGKSRSATCVIAYLMQKHGISPTEALEQIRQSRPLCEPNEGFMKQLELYHEMQMPDDPSSNAVYQKWLYQREIELSRACGQAPEAEKIRFEDEHVSKEQEGVLNFKCKKCRYVYL